MKKLTAILLAFALALCCGALAESDNTYYPESEAFVGTWYADDFILEIAHMADDYNLFTCAVTQYGEENKGTRWFYDACAYDGASKALSSLDTGCKFHVDFDEFGNPSSSEPARFTDGAATFALNADGALTWTDFKEAPGENERVFQKVVDDAANPLAAYEGTWVGGRATLVIEDLDDSVCCTIRWGGSAFDDAEWVYEDCLYDEVSGGLSTAGNGVKTEVTYDENGEVVESRVIYDDGAASFVINDEGKLIWTDFKATPGENEFAFEKLGGLSDYGMATTLDRSLIESFAATVRDAYLKADWNALAPLMSYPVEVAPGQTARTPLEFAACMSGKAPTAQDAADMEAEDCRDLFVNQQGICMGNGQVWFVDVNFDGIEQADEPLLRIIRINGVE